MKFSISQSELQNALSVVLKGVSTRSTLPVLSGVLVTAKQDEIVLETTDLVLSIRQTCPALIEEPGATVFPARFFSDIVKNLSDAAVSITVEDDFAEIYCDSASFNIKTLNPDDFPGFPHVDTGLSISLPFSKFADMVKRVARVVSKDESRAILTGVLVTAENGLLKMVATDSYRLAVTQYEIPSDITEFEAVIAGNFLLDIAALAKNENNITLALAENQIVITYGKTVFINRRIEGNFPNYKQLLPDTHSARVKVNTQALMGAVKRSSLLGTNASPVKFLIDTVAQKIELSASSQDIGSVKDEIPCEGEGETTEIAFNCSYVLEGLNSIETENMFIEVQSPLKPGILTADKEESYLYLIMPVRIS